MNKNIIVITIMIIVLIVMIIGNVIRWNVQDKRIVLLEQINERLHEKYNLLSQYNTLAKKGITNNKLLEEIYLLNIQISELYDKIIATY